MQEQKDALELSRMKLEEERREKALKLAHKDAEMADMRQKMEDMALEFGAPRALARPASSVVVFFWHVLGVWTSLRGACWLVARLAGDMLKETLDKMGAQIEISSGSFDSGGASMTRRLDEFKMGVAADV